MELHIPKLKYNLKFIFWVRRRLKLEVLSRIDKTYPVFEQCLKDTFNVAVNTSELLFIAMNNLIVYDTTKEYIIKIDPLIKYKDTNLTVERLVNIFNIGNLQFKGFQIITNCINKLSSNLDYYNKVTRQIYLY